jgi:hypothetical protein
MGKNESDCECASEVDQDELIDGLDMSDDDMNQLAEMSSRFPGFAFPWNFRASGLYETRSSRPGRFPAPQPGPASPAAEGDGSRTAFAPWWFRHEESCGTRSSRLSTGSPTSQRLDRRPTTGRLFMSMAAHCHARASLSW